MFCDKKTYLLCKLQSFPSAGVQNTDIHLCAVKCFVERMIVMPLPSMNQTVDACHVMLLYKL